MTIITPNCPAPSIPCIARFENPKLGVRGELFKRPDNAGFAVMVFDTDEEAYLPTTRIYQATEGVQARQYAEKCAF